MTPLTRNRLIAAAVLALWIAAFIHLLVTNGPAP